MDDLQYMLCIRLLCRVRYMRKRIRDSFGLVYRTQQCQLNVAKSQNGTVPVLYLLYFTTFGTRQHKFVVVSLWTSDMLCVFA